MRINTFLTKVFIFALIFVSILQFISVHAADPVNAALEYGRDNAFTVTVPPGMNGSVALYYQKENGDIDAVFGGIGAKLAAQTCSNGVCVNAVVQFGVAKVYLADQQLLKIFYFKNENGSLIIAREAVLTNVSPNDVRTASTLGAPPDNPLLQLTQAEESWLKNPAAEEFLPSVTPSPTNTPLPTKAASPTLSPSPTPAVPVVPKDCVPGSGYIYSTVAVHQTTQLNGLPVPAYRSDSSYGYGAPDVLFFSLGVNGSVTFKFAGVVQDVPGIDFSVYEETLGRNTYPEERAKVEISDDNSIWHTLPTLASGRSPLGITAFDIVTAGLTSFQYIRLTDVKNPFNLNFDYDGFDVNAIVATSQNCPTPTPTVTPTPTIPGETGLLLIQKANNRVGQSVIPGGDVTYAITVKSEQGGLAGVQVVDLPPGGFSYEHGSWTAHSDLRGDLKAGGTTTEPTYHSPGTWQLGDMQPGETVTLSYKVHVNSDVDGGVYTDLAWAQSNQATVLSQGTTSPFVDNEFVGTDVAVARSQEKSAHVDIRTQEGRGGAVLGASTQILPATGANSELVLLAIAAFVGGLLGVAIGFSFLLKKKLPLALKPAHRLRVFRFMASMVVWFSVGIIGAIVVVPSVSAAAITTIRISLPQNRNNRDFKIHFVTLDSENRAITVKCYKKGPGDSGFVQFGGDISLAPGGNSGTCNVDSSVVGTNSADYQFMASAQAAGGAVVNSQVVGTSFSNEAPGTPVNYHKEQNGCDYTIFFKTADDNNKTKKVEIYRSEWSTFTADNNAKVGEVATNSNEEKSFTNAAPCSKKYFYVVRAFDSFGNGSGVVGDSQVIPRYDNNGNLNGSTTNQASGSAIAVNNSEVGEVQGEATQPAVLGATAEAILKQKKIAEKVQEENWKKYVLWTIIGLVIAGIAYVITAKKE